MFIAMNRFQVHRGREAEFEQLWLNRETHLQHMPGFIEFQLLRGPSSATHTLFASHTVWASRDAFEAWTRSSAFRAAHRNAGAHGGLYAGHPQFEGFEVLQELR
ncbi:MAG: antibiotic biosynthesis monooxygenase family protein [Alphaproteobacteria bacterium]